MTPLFMRALEAERRLQCHADRIALASARFIDASEISDLVANLVSKLRAERCVPMTAHKLPFPRIAVQTTSANGLLFDATGGHPIGDTVASLWEWDARALLLPIGYVHETPDSLEKTVVFEAEGGVTSVGKTEMDALEQAWHVHYKAVAVLACINSPRIVEAEQVKPTFTQSRKLKALGVAPDVRMTKIVLRVHRTREEGADSDHETLTGARALHMCRQHLPILPTGKLTWWLEHWRCDASRGVRIGS